MTQTIFALSTASGFSGVAVIRISGENALKALEKVCHFKNPEPRKAYLKSVFKEDKKIDEALVLYFKAPHSFTGEECVEIQCHGSRAVIRQILEILGEIPNFRMAEKGEFTRRALYNGKLDLTAAEGLIDLIHAKTEKQAEWAVRQMGGELKKIYDGWREELKYALAYLEAYIDFPEEEIDESELEKVNKKIYNVITFITNHLKNSQRGKALKEGILFAIVGAPNVGKSSLLNAIAQKEIAIVNQRAGTTRDVLETYLNIEGYPVIFADTAGLRETEEEIEQEGIRRALKKAEEADFVLVIEDASVYPRIQSEKYIQNIDEEKIIRLWNKKDKAKSILKEKSISAQTGDGLEDLFKLISEKVIDFMGNKEDVLLTRERYKENLEKCRFYLEEALNPKEIELKAEDLRFASKELGKITGEIQINELLDVIFSEFCIGK